MAVNRATAAGVAIALLASTTLHAQQAPEAGRSDAAQQQDSAPLDAKPLDAKPLDAKPLDAKPPGTFKPETPAETPDVWIFSGELQGSREPFSGTLVASNGKAQFELKLASGATCDGSNLSGEVGLVRLSEITCSDDRPMKALFVPQGGKELKVFGSVGDERFTTSAHLLGTEAVPDKPQTAEPKGPLGQPPAPPPAQPSPSPADPKGAPAKP